VDRESFLQTYTASLLELADLLLETSDGAVWATSTLGVSRFDGDRWQTFIAADILGLEELTEFNLNINFLLESRDGSLWISMEGLGVSRFDGDRWQTYTVADGMTSPPVRTLLESADGSIWVGTDNGVSRFDGKLWQTFTTAEGLAGNGVRVLREGADGSVWAATNSGVSRFDGAWRNFDGEALLSGNPALFFVDFDDLFVHVLFEASDGALWVGSSRGVSRFNGTFW
jgi:ligand-binding sensor domain-containing protein